MDFPSASLQLALTIASSALKITSHSEEHVSSCITQQAQPTEQALTAQHLGPTRVPSPLTSPALLTSIFHQLGVIVWLLAFVLP